MCEYELKPKEKLHKSEEVGGEEEEERLASLTTRFSLLQGQRRKVPKSYYNTRCRPFLISK